MQRDILGTVPGPSDHRNLGMARPMLARVGLPDPVLVEEGLHRPLPREGASREATTGACAEICKIAMALPLLATMRTVGCGWRACLAKERWTQLLLDFRQANAHQEGKGKAVPMFARLPVKVSNWRACPTRSKIPDDPPTPDVGPLLGEPPTNVRKHFQKLAPAPTPPPENAPHRPPRWLRRGAAWESSPHGTRGGPGRCGGHPSGPAGRRRNRRCTRR